MTGVSKKWLRTFGAVFVLLSLQQLSVNAIAGSTVIVTVGEDGEVTSAGSVTLSMINVTTKLLGYFGDNPEVCYQGEERNGVVCNIANTDNVKLEMGCEIGDSSLDCALEVNREGQEIPLRPYEISCEKDEAGGGSCTITSDDEGVSEIIDGMAITNSNIANIANSFLSCFQGAVGSAEATCSALFNALNENNDEKAIQILNSLVPLNPEVTADLARDNLRNTTSVVLSRLGQIRTNTTMASNVSTQLFFVNNQWLQSGARLAANDSLASDVTPGTVSTSISDFGKLGFFINLNATDGKYKDGSLSSKSDFSSTLLTLGFDYRVRDDLVTGLAFNVGQSKTKYKATVNGTMDAENYSLIVYNSYYKSNWYFDSSLTLGGDTYKQKRDPGLGNSFEAEYHSRQYNISLAGGYDFYVQGFGLTPFMQLDFGQLHVDGYTEKAKNSSGGGAPLAISKHKRDIGSFSAGGRFRYIFTTSKGVFIPNLSL